VEWCQTSWKCCNTLSTSCTVGPPIPDGQLSSIPRGKLPYIVQKRIQKVRTCTVPYEKVPITAKGCHTSCKDAIYWSQALFICLKDMCTPRNLRLFLWPWAVPRVSWVRACPGPGPCRCSPGVDGAPLWSPPSFCKPTRDVGGLWDNLWS